MNKNKIIIIIVVVLTLFIAFFQTFQKIGQEQIKIWDEARGAVNAIEMLQNHDYIVVRFDGEPDRWDTKSPFFIWFKVISYKVFGINEFAVRFPTAVFVMLTVLLFLYFSIRYFKEPWTGIIAILILVNTLGYMVHHVARTGEPDSMLIFFVLLYSLAWYYFLDAYPHKRNFLLFVFSSSFFLAIFTKNIAGVAPMAGVFAYTLFRFKVFKMLIKDYRVYLSIAFALLLVVVYFAVREHFDVGYTKVVVQHEITGMFFHYFPGKPKNPEFNFYFKYIFNKGFKYYVFLLLLSVPVLFFSKDKNRKQFIIFNYIFSIVFLLGYSKSVAKNEWYIAPIFPFLSLIVATSFVELFTIIKENERIKKAIKYALNISLFLILILIIYNQGRRVFRINVSYFSVYEREYEGLYLRKYHNLYPDIKQITVLSNHYSGAVDPNLDQVKFYIKAFNYSDSTNFTVQQKVDNNLVGKYILTCDTDLVKDIKKLYSIEVIDMDNHSLLARITDFKANSMRNSTLFFENIKSTNLVFDSYKLFNVSDAFSEKIVSIKIDYLDECVYMWLKDSSLFSVNYLDATVNQKKYTLPSGYSTSDIADISIDVENKTVYTFFKDNKTSKGTVENLGNLLDIEETVYPQTYSAQGLVAVAYSPISKQFFYWFDDGMVSSGTENDATYYRDLYPYSCPLLFSKIDILTCIITKDENLSVIYNFIQ